MPYSRMCDTYAFHPKVVQAGNEAVGVHARLIAWSSGNLTDGFVPDAIVDMMAGAKRVKIVTAALTSASLLHRDNARAGWHLHGYLDHNPSSKDVKDKRAEDAARKRAERSPSKGSPNGHRTDTTGTPAVVNEESHKTQQGVQAPPRAGAHPLLSSPTPSEPPPTPPVDAGNGAVGEPAEPEPVVAEVDAELTADKPLTSAEVARGEELSQRLAAQSGGMFDAFSGTSKQKAALYRAFRHRVVDNDLADEMSLQLAVPKKVWTWAKQDFRTGVGIGFLLGRELDDGFSTDVFGQLVTCARLSMTAKRAAAVKESQRREAAPVAPKTLVTGDDVTRLKPSFLRVVAPSSGSSDVG